MWPKENVKERLKFLWALLRDQKVGDLADKFEEYAKNVEAGADPIEAMSGHLCGPKCWHWEGMTEARKRKLRKAPWNRKEKSP